MSLFEPSATRPRFGEVTPELLRELGVRAVLLDVDNTLGAYSSSEPAHGAVEWTRELSAAGFRLAIVSNNFDERVTGFAHAFDLPFVSFAIKPLPFGYLRAAKGLGVPRRECAVIGDQIFTDVLGANLCGMKSVLLEPMELEPGWTFRVRRRLERRFRVKFKMRKDVRK